MKKKKHCILALSLGALFLLIQLLLWRNVEERYSEESNKITFGKFIYLARHHGLPVFVIDPPALTYLTVRSLGKTNCKIICGDSANRVSLGVDGRFIGTQVESFMIASHEEVGFDGHCMFGLLPLKTSHNSVLTHCYFQKANFIIDLVIFHEIDSQFWWHGIGDKQADIRVFADHEGAFPHISTKKVVIDGLQLRIPTNPQKFLLEIPKSILIPCNYTRQAIFRSTYKQDTNDKDEEYFSLKAIELIRQAKEVLDHLGIPFWLSSGTCLGWYRQCDVIPYSKDVDFGIFIKDYQVSIIPSMQKAGLKLKHKFGKVSDSYELSFQGDKIKLDIFFFYEEQNYTWNGGTQTRTGNKYKYIFPKFSLCWTYFFSMKLRVPCQTKDYIEANYGKEWFKPIQNWDWKASPSNVVKNGVWPHEEWGEVINIYIT